MRKKILIALIGLMLGAVLAVLLSNVGASAVKEVWLYSYFRFSLLAGLAGVIFYLVVSFGRERLLVWNAVGLVSSMAALGALELGLRFFPGVVPDNYLTLFPAPAQKKIAASRGMFNFSTLRGQDMIHSYLPGWRHPRRSWLKIDEDGYRNPKRPQGSVDVVLLGDSVMIAESAKKDLGARFREVGLSAVNYGFGGYGLFHYRDVYRKLVLERGMSHRWVVVMITTQNDIANSLHYLKVKESGGDWRDFLNRPTSMGWPAWADGRYTPWSVSAILKIPFLLRQDLINAKNEKISVVLPRETITANPGLLWFPDVASESPERRVVKDSLKELIADATRAGAKIVLALAPNSALIYGPYVKDHERRFEIIKRNLGGYLSLLKTNFAGENVSVIDLSSPLSSRVGVEPVGAYNLDYHLNDRGVEIVFDSLRQVITR